MSEWSQRRQRRLKIERSAEALRGSQTPTIFPSKSKLPSDNTAGVTARAKAWKLAENQECHTLLFYVAARSGLGDVAVSCFIDEIAHLYLKLRFKRRYKCRRPTTSSQPSTCGSGQV